MESVIEGPILEAAGLPAAVMPAESNVLQYDPVCEISTEEVVVPQDSGGWLDPFQVRFEIDYASDEDDVDRMGFGLLMHATGGLGIETGVRLFREEAADFRDHLWIGDFNVVYELSATKYVRTRAGVGLNWLADRYGAAAGLNLTAGTDVFAGPVTFSGELDFGTMGDADVLHGRITAAVRLQEHAEWFAGYDYLDIGGVEIHGVLAGLRFRF